MILRGIAASSGIAIGPLFRVQVALPATDRRSISDPEAEWKRYQDACAVASEQVSQVRAKANEEFGAEQAAIFDAQILMLTDPELSQSVHEIITKQHMNAEYALKEVSELYARSLEAMPDEYLRARAADIRDVVRRLLHILGGHPENSFDNPGAPAIIVADDLSPSDTVMMDKKRVLGFATAQGGPTSHTAILARQLGLPAVVGLGQQALTLETSKNAILDGDGGKLIIEPGEATYADYENKHKRSVTVLRKALEQAHKPAITTDGHTVEVVANIADPADATQALDHGAEGVGLFRTEFLFLERASLPSEDEQLAAYTRVLQAFDQKPVILRTLDVGGDKALPYVHQEPELNPFLGLRGIRLCLAHPELFKPQLRAALRAVTAGNLKLMFPMVSSTAEVEAVRSLLEQCQTELEREGYIVEPLEIGIMVEVPAAVLLVDQFATMVDFFSIGTNDLGQYVMAADRTNARVASMANGLEPALLKLIKQTIDQAHAASKWVGVCGELAAEPRAIPVLLGLGLDEFSMNPRAIPMAKQLIRQLSFEDCQALAQEALSKASKDEITNLVVGQIPILG